MADTDTPASPEPAKKPAARRRTTTPAKAAASKPRAPKAKTPDSQAEAKTTAKSRSTKRATPPASGTQKVVTKTKKAAQRATDKVGGKWGAAAIVGGLAVAGAALLTLRSSSAKPTDPAKPGGAGVKAHQPDGTDSSASFEAGIADENTVPDKV